MGWLEDIGTWWNDVTGSTAQRRAEAQAAEASAQNTANQKKIEEMYKQESEANARARAAVEGAMGGSIQDYLSRMDASARPMAEQEAQTMATQGARQAAMAARSSGLNRGQSALAAGRQTGELYGGAYQGALERGRGLYQQGTNAFAQQAGQSMANRMGAAGLTQAGVNAGLQASAQNQQMGQQQAATTWGTLGNVAGAGLGLLSSDERVKDDIERAPDVSEIADAIAPVQFRYKGEPEDVARVGVIAQDLEQSPLRDTVVDTPQGKMIDTVQLTPAILDMVVQLTKRIEAMEGKKNV